MKQLLPILLFFAAHSLFAQTLYTRANTIPVTDDSITLKVEKFRGNIQWQHSIDGQNWSNISGKTNAKLKVNSGDEGYYRSKITDGTCFQVYSDTAAVVSNKFRNIIVDPEKISGVKLIQRNDSTNTFTFIKTGVFDSIPLGTIFLNKDTVSTIAIVKNVCVNRDTIQVLTNLGTMEDLFLNQEFNLSTETATTRLKSLQNTPDNYIHPFAVIDNNHFMQVKNRLKNDVIPNVSFNYDFSGKKLYSNNGLELAISSGYFKLNGEIKCNFKFERSGFNWKSFNFSQGKLTSFKFYTDTSTLVESKIVLTATASSKISMNEETTLAQNVFNKTFGFLIGEIPVWMTVKMDIMAKKEADFNSNLSVSAGFSSTHKINLGASYEAGTWSSINNVSNQFNLISPSLSGHNNCDVQVDVYPRVEIMFYSSVGPYLQVVPYLSENMANSLSGNYNFGIYSGLDTKVGLSGTILGKEIFDYSKDFSVIKDTLYQQPCQLKLVSGDQQQGIAGKVLSAPIVLMVLDSEGNPVPNYPVNFNAGSGSIDNSTPLTDTNGEASVKWTLGSSEGTQTLEAFLKDGNDQKINGSSLRITCQSKIDLPSVETYPATNILKNSATSGGTVNSDGGTIVSSYGICWNTSGNPTILDNKTISGSGNGNFSSELTGLKDSTTYFVRAYATNSKGTGYGNEISFNTANESQSGTFTDSRDGHVYKWVKIGTQVWMAENLAYLPSVNSPGHEGSYNSPQYYVYSYNGTDVAEAKATANYKNWGVLYNWTAANYSCPAGWHLPNNDEWAKLADYLGGADTAGSKMKSLTGWTSPNTGATNSSGFSAISTGNASGSTFCNFSDANSIGQYASWWSSSTGSDWETAWLKSLIYNSSSLNLGTAYSFRENCVSVRCIKD